MKQTLLSLAVIVTGVVYIAALLTGQAEPSVAVAIMALYSLDRNWKSIKVS